MRIEVFHINNILGAGASAVLGDTKKVAALLQGKQDDVRYKKVATVTSPLESEDALDDAFRYTNHIDRDWTTNPQVSEVADRHVRSTSVGDVLRVDGDFYLVAPFGFKAVILPEDAKVVVE